MTHDSNDKILRLLEEAAKQLVRTAAEMQAKGIDTTSLSRPVVTIGDAIKELSQSSTRAQDGEEPAESMAFTCYNSDKQADEA